MLTNGMQHHQLTRDLLEMAVKKIYVFLPGDIKEENESTVELLLKTDLDTVKRLRKEGGLFIEYNFKSL